MPAPLATIFALTMIWTVESKSSVSPDGELPGGISAEYSCSYQKGTVRAGDEAVFSLSGLSGITIEKVDVYMRSNKTAGAGTITLTMNQRLVLKVTGTFRDWTGAYDNTDYHPLTLFEGQHTNVSEMAITVEGTANSLYIEKYVISYQPAQAYTVTLMAGNQELSRLTEASGGAGVLLPAADDYDQWQFVGWSQTEFWLSHTMPEHMKAGTTYFPHGNITLWAIWERRNEQDASYQTDLHSGEYIYANRNAQIAMSGYPSDQRMTPAPIDPDDANQVYYIDFRDNGTAVIQHVLSGVYVGYSGKELARNQKEWLVYHEGDQTLFYIELSGMKYVLWLDVWDSHTQSGYTGLQPTSNLDSPMGLLLPNTGDDEPAYTCHPESEDNSLIPASTNETVVPFGLYEIHVRNGEKYVRLRH